MTGVQTCALPISPLLAFRYGPSVAVAAVALPHAIATALRFWRLRAAVDRGLLLRFGLLSAIGGLAGALWYARLGSRTVFLVLAVLLIMTAVAGLTGWAERVRARGAVAWLLGLASGFFGGVVGNQGGLRAAALMSFGLAPAAFVATSTAIALCVDAVRAPVYLVRAGAELTPLAWPIAVASAGTVFGTLIGERILFGLGPRRFRAIVSSIIGILGVWLLVRPG